MARNRGNVLDELDELDKKVKLSKENWQEAFAIFKSIQPYRAHFFTGLLFILLSSPEAYKLTTKYVGVWITKGGGVPTPGGLVFHAFVFMVLVFLLMKIRT